MYRHFTSPSSVIKGQELKTYFLEHCESKPRLQGYHGGSFWEVVKPLKVFKSASHGIRLVALEIPPGAYVYAPASAFCTWSPNAAGRKMRASKANVHSIHVIEPHRIVGNRGAPRSRVAPGLPVTRAFSSNTPDFKYETGMTVTPTTDFSFADDSCASGIHFFLNFHDAYNY